MTDVLDRIVTRHLASRNKTAGEVRFIKDRGGDDKDWGWVPPGASERNIDPDYTFDARNLKPLAQTLRSALMALGHIQTARTTFTKIRSATISPDGNLGGKGYVLTIKDVRKMLSNCDEALSSLTDCLHDEMQAVHWHPDVADSGGNTRERTDVKQIMDDVDEIRQDPENWAEDEESEMDSGNEGKQARRKVAWTDPEPEPCPDEDLAAADQQNRIALQPLMKALLVGFRQRGWTVKSDEILGPLKDKRVDALEISFGVYGSAGQTIRMGNREMVLDRDVVIGVNGEFLVGTVQVEVEHNEPPRWGGDPLSGPNTYTDVDCPDGIPHTLDIYLPERLSGYPATVAGMQKMLLDFDKHWPQWAKVRSRLRPRRRLAHGTFESRVVRLATRWLVRGMR